MEKAMTRSEAIDLVGYAIDDSQRFHNGELTGEFTREDVRQSGRDLLRKLMNSEPPEADIDEAMRIY